MEDFNRLDTWLPPLMHKAGLSVEQLAQRSKLNRAAVYQYLNDKTRPSTQAMARMCAVLGVPLEEGLAQYTPRKAGRPLKIQQVKFH